MIPDITALMPARNLRQWDGIEEYRMKDTAAAFHIEGDLHRRLQIMKTGLLAANIELDLQAYKTIAAREAIEATGARMLFLPPYNPDFNPIENAFLRLKAILRKAAARTVPELRDAIRDALPRFTPEECTNYFTATEYEQERLDSTLVHHPYNSIIKTDN